MPRFSEAKELWRAAMAEGGVSLVALVQWNPREEDREGKEIT